ncbi:hypothetical protein SDC9_91665 [bioreactor metagenome]|uniref:Uncharacterized protein n=1 Tax=bioreactor metagenome TaxID=1076179 RepID=A0A644ZVI7_9ZZZZ
MVVSSREIVEDVISNTGSKLTVSYKRHRMLNHAKSKDAFARFEAVLVLGKWPISEQCKKILNGDIVYTNAPIELVMQ